MICFRDMTFCSSKVHRPDCRRQWTTELQFEADEWWVRGGGQRGEAPVAFSEFCSTTPAAE